MTDVILVVDLGTQSIRGTALDRDGHVWFQRSHPIATDREAGRCEQDPLVWRDRLHELLAEAHRSLGSRIRAMTATGTLSGLVCLDDGGRPLRPAIMYGDQRSRGQAARIQADAAFPNQGGWRAHSCDFLPQLLYLAEQEPEIYRRSRHVLDSTGYLNFLLTGQMTMDAYTRFHCYGDPARHDLPSALLRNFGLEASRLGRLAEPGEMLPGPGGTPVIMTTFDSVCAYLGAGLSAFGDALDISGTVTSFGVLHSRCVADPQRRVYSLPWTGGNWLIRGSTAMSGGVLEWARREIVGGGFEEFNALVGQSRPGSGGVVFLPYLAGERAPIWSENACGTFFGLRPETTRADMARSVYEGLGFSLRHIQTVIEEQGVTIGTVRLAGGLARNGFLNRIKADITGRTVRTVRNLELTTLGCAAVAGVAVGWYADLEDAHGRLLELCPEITPDPGVAEIYGESFRRYRDLVTALGPLFA